ncbi:MULTISPECIES: alpha/beta hydrolase [Planktothricoides]|uniref:Alpha/beta hydrolase n=2 Tax=Planktothricoides raciborskii TaxID=132608 RepID=A0AAU8JES0_9CYAN|nr:MULTISPECIES: alpha/beta hydrolase [Planktothricoides]MBD2544271.1 alpha/beta hydrolase [Planktothricoides raciborskii FACHB-1370]MBD2583623.1 alpha/beta hydrolase [Planktothricoides raciborskii FACHB-1261]
MNIKYRSDFMQKLRPNTQFFQTVGKRCLSLFLAFVVAIVATFSFNTQNALAANEINLIYRGVREVITLQDLENFVRRGSLPDALNRLKLSGDEISILREALGQEIPLPKKFVEKFLSSSIGQFILSRIDPVIGDGTMNSVENLADGFLNAAGNDQINLLELFEFYPASQISVQGELVSDAVNRVRLIADTVIPLAEVVRGYMYDIVCTDDLFGYQPDTQIPDILAGSRADKFSWLK